MYGFRLTPRNLGACILVLMGGVCLMTGSAEPGVPDTSPTNQLSITSQTMTMQGKARKAVFEENVVLVMDDMTIHSDRMVVTFKPEEEGHKKAPGQGKFAQQVEVVEATGHVVIDKSSGKATSGRAVYYTDEEKVILTESPEACQNGTRVTGQRMTMYLKDDRSIVEGQSRVTIEEQCE